MALPQEEGEGGEPYSREQVDALRTAVVATLKHATNIRVLEPADRIAIVHRGRTLAQGTLADLTEGGARSLEELFLSKTAGETV